MKNTKSTGVRGKTKPVVGAPAKPSPKKALASGVYVVAVNQKEAASLAPEFGWTRKEDARGHLELVKLPPTDPYYASQYRVYFVRATASGGAKSGSNTPACPPPNTEEPPL